MTTPTHAVIEFLKDGNGFDNGGMQQHGHFNTWEDAATKADELRSKGEHGRVSIVPLMDSRDYLD